MRIQNPVSASSEDYRTNIPFPHVLIKDLWDDGFLKRVEEAVLAFEDWDGEKEFYGSRAKRWCATWEKMPQPVIELIEYASKPQFLKWLEELTGEKNLIPDPYLQGGGIHSIDTGGFLKMHADFNWHEQLSLYRRLNMLIYLNSDWEESWGGDLRLAARADGGVGLRTEKTIFPYFNNTVIFTTDDHSYHGHPDPLASPAGVARKSIALYYYTPNKPDGAISEKRNDTDYRREDGERFKESSPIGLLLSNPKAFTKKALSRLNL